MKKFAISLFLLVIVFLAVSYNLGKLNVYAPLSEEVHVSVSEVETGNHLIDMSEVNVILLIMLVGAFLVVR